MVNQFYVIFNLDRYPYHFLPLALTSFFKMISKILTNTGDRKVDFGDPSLSF